MKPFYYTRSTNFGDHMNSWLWSELIPEAMDPEDGLRLVGIGSLLSRNLDLVDGRKVIFGTGSGYSSLPDQAQAAQWRIYCVRGPLTARYLGLEPEKAITDAAWLINRIPRYSAVPTARKGTVFVPHWTSAAYGNWSVACPHLGIDYVDPLWSCERVFPAIANAELALVESLHGAIIADYYRTPWIPVVSPGRILKYKWIDWCQSLGMDYQPFLLPPSDYLDCLMQRISPRAIEFPTTPLHVPSDTFDVPQTPPPPKKAGIRYHAKRRTRAKLHKLRNYTLENLDTVRNNILLHGWNERHWDNLGGYFDAVKASAPFLSRDAIRMEKIERLNDALDLMRDDYQAGRI